MWDRVYVEDVTTLEGMLHFKSTFDEYSLGALYLYRCFSEAFEPKRMNLLRNGHLYYALFFTDRRT